MAAGSRCVPGWRRDGLVMVEPETTETRSTQWVENPEPYQLLRDLAAYIRRFVVVTDAQAVCIALWVIHSHAFEAAQYTPYLSLRSPERRSGKTTLMEILELLTPRPRLWICPSEAVFYRAIAKYEPTVLLDEIDTVFDEDGAEHEGLRAALNAGTRKGATVPRCIGGDHDVEEFSVYCAKVLAGIGKLPDTVEDRCIPINMKRKKRSEKVERWRIIKDTVGPPGVALRGRAETWAAVNLTALRGAEPELPEELHDRAQDGVEPLLAIAELAGSAYAEEARHAFVEVLEAEEDYSLPMRLLRDTRTVFHAAGDPPQVHSAKLIEGLNGLEEAPWKHRGEEGVTQNTVAWMLKKYDIHPEPRAIRIDGTQARGYKRAPFNDAWDRYIYNAGGVTG